MASNISYHFIKYNITLSIASSIKHNISSSTYIASSIKHQEHNIASNIKHIHGIKHYMASSKSSMQWSKKREFRSEQSPFSLMRQAVGGGERGSGVEARVQKQKEDKRC